MLTLRFRFADAQREIEAIKSISRQFLFRGDEKRFDDLHRSLEAVRVRREASASWGWDRSAPVRTRECKGQYEVGGRGHHRRAFAQISSVWEIGYATPSEFRLLGNASVVIVIKDANLDGDDLARWRMEIGASDSPGAFFHTQVLSDEHQPEPPFPKSLSIPRFPSLPISPMSAIDFTLGELFQREWIEQTKRSGGPFGIWRSMQKKTLSRYFDWQLAQVEASASPLMALKDAKPPEGLFIDPEDPLPGR